MRKHEPTQREGSIRPRGKGQQAVGTLTRNDFDLKAEGQVDEAGEGWRPLWVGDRSVQDWRRAQRRCSKAVKR